ncbi:MAG TPA: class I SAM-dependent methyltransferase [Vicinamibacterales bacterium]|nr:class I SAM-dependent methyltransferase [Vicinamibacterales bacterium]
MIDFPELCTLDAARLQALGEASPALAAEVARHAHDGVWLAGADAGLARARLDARRGLARARARILDIRQRLGPGARVVWVLPNPHAWGLDPDEARAVAEEHLAVDSASAAGEGDSAFTVIAGIVRRDVVGLLLSIRDLGRTTMGRMVGHARRIRRAGLPIAAVLIADPGDRVAAWSPLLARGRSAVHRVFGDAVFGTWIRAADASPGFERSARLTAALGGSALPLIACDNPFAAPEWETLIDGRVAADLSWPAVPHPPEPVGSVARTGAWLTAGAYRPLEFDSRVPGAASHAGVLRVVRTPIARGFDATWSRWRGPRADLDRLLDYLRFESFLRRLDDTGLAQRYHEFKVFAHAGGGPAVRTTLLELDEQVSEAQCALLIEECVAAQTASAGTLAVAGGEAFLTAARAEADARVQRFGADALARQRKAHAYLETIPADAPLRADVVALIGAMPGHLGRALEIGAGTGRLARELAPRAAQYVCVDLQPETMPRGGGAVSVVSDLHNLPAADGQFDTLIANNVLEHAADPVAALREVRRVLSPEGRLYALVPLDALSSEYDLPAHLWKADMIGIERAASAAGLRIDRAEALNLYGLGVAGSFPSCYGWVCLLVAGRSKD